MSACGRWRRWPGGHLSAPLRLRRRLSAAVHACSCIRRPPALPGGRTFCQLLPRSPLRPSRHHGCVLRVVQAAGRLARGRRQRGRTAAAGDSFWALPRAPAPPAAGRCLLLRHNGACMAVVTAPRPPPLPLRRRPLPPPTEQVWLPRLRACPLPPAGYAGYFSTTARIKDKRTPLEAALSNVGRCAPGRAAAAPVRAACLRAHAPACSLPRPASLESLELMEKLTKNSAVQPAEEKFRRLKLRCGLGGLGVVRPGCQGAHHACCHATPTAAASPAAPAASLPVASHARPRPLSRLPLPTCHALATCSCCAAAATPRSAHWWWRWRAGWRPWRRWAGSRSRRRERSC